MSNIKVCWLPQGSYVEMTATRLWVKPEDYIPVKSNEDTIKHILWWWVWLLPIKNNNWWQVREVMRHLPDLISCATMIWHTRFEINHVLACQSCSSLGNITEIHWHTQALVQCASSLRDMWTNPDTIISRQNKINNPIPDTTKYIIEVDNKIWILRKITEILSYYWINIEYIHSTPYGKWKYRFYFQIKNKYRENMLSNTLLDEFSEIWWSIIEDKKHSEWKIKLVSRKSNVDWVIDAMNNPNVWAICSKETADLYWLQIQNPNFAPERNRTSFALVANKNIKCNFDDLTWLYKKRAIGLLTLPNRKWILNQVLKEIEEVKINLSFIMSLKADNDICQIALVCEKWKNWETSHIKQKVDELKWNLEIL